MSSTNPERDYLEMQIALLMKERAELPQQFSTLKAQQEAKIEAFLAETGVLPRVQAMRAEIENLLKAVQGRADNLTGRIEALQGVLDAFHTVKVSSGTTFDPVSGEPLPTATSRTHTPVNAPEVSGSEVYAYENEADDSETDEDDESDEAWGDKWDEEFAREMTGVGADNELEESEEDEDTSSEDENEDDEADSADDIADAIENAPDEAAVRALLARYRKA